MKARKAPVRKARPSDGRAKLAEDVPHRRCPSQRKLMYTKKQAKRAQKAMISRGAMARVYRHKVPDCGAWHTTTKEA